MQIKRRNATMCIRNSPTPVPMTEINPIIDLMTKKLHIQQPSCTLGPFLGSLVLSVGYFQGNRCSVSPKLCVNLPTRNPRNNPPKKVILISIGLFYLSGYLKIKLFNSSQQIIQYNSI